MTYPVMQHYRKEETQFNLERVYAQESNMGLKPNGLWLSCNDDGVDWKEWCECEDFRTDHLRVVYDVKLKDDANIIVLEKEEDFAAFDKKYGVNLLETPRISFTEWPEVVRDYQGMFLPNYSRIFSAPLWHNCWDCSSACIWDLSIIESITLANRSNEKCLTFNNQ